MTNNETTPPTASAGHGRSPLRRLALTFLFGMGALMAFKLGLFLWKGGETALILFAGRGIYAGHPLSYLAWGTVYFLAGYVVLMWSRYQKRDWWLLCAKLTLLLFSAGLTVFAGEVGIRGWLLRTRAANSLERLKQLYKEHKKPEVHTTHPMSYIIELPDDPHLVYDLQPNLDMEFGHKRLRTNSAGMRADHDYPVTRQPQTVRIVGIGDSGMFGWNCEQGEEYMAGLERLLNQRHDGGRYESLNFGVPGYNTQLEMEMLRRKALAYQPDIVIVGWCDNDYGLPFFMLEQQDFRRWNVSYLYQFLFHRTHFLDDTAPVRFTELRGYNKDEVLPEIRAGVDVKGVRDAVQLLKQLSVAHHFHLLFFGPMDATICGICKERGVPYYNTFEKIPENAYPADFAVHYMHPRPEGHRVLAEHLAQELVDRHWLQPWPPSQKAAP